VGLKQSRVVPTDRKKKKNPLPNNNISLPHDLLLTPLSRARRAQLKGRSNAEVTTVDFATGHYLPIDYRLTIGCR